MKEGHAKQAASEPSIGNVPNLSLQQRAALGASLNTSRLSDVLGPRNKEAAGELEDPKEENEQLSEDLQLLAHRLERECFYIIFKVFPARIRKLDALYKMDPRFSLSSEQIKSAGPLPVLPSDKRKDSVPIDSANRKDTIVPANESLVTLAEALKDEILLLGENMGSLSIWIQLNVPRMQDNASFSSEVQMQLLEQIKGAESVSVDVLDQFATYYVTRGELITKLLKYPGLEDFRRAIVEVDEKMYMKTAMVAADIRSLYLLLFDMLSKNLSALLEAPKSGENKEVTSKMYY